MASIVHVENTHKTGSKRKKVIIVIGLFVLIFGAGGYAAYRYFGLPWQHTTPTANQDTLTKLRNAYDASKKEAANDPQNTSKQSAASDAKSALANEYLAKKDYTSAQTTLDDGATSIQKLQSEAIIAEEKGDLQGAINALKQQVAYYKALPATDYSYDYDIAKAERKITELQGEL